MSAFLRLLRFLKPFTGEVLLSILMGVVTIASGIGLMGTSAYLIATAALHPSIADLQIAIVGVRFFGISRAVFRYLERLISHSVNLHVLSRLREWFYLRVESSPPEEYQTHRTGDLLDRVMGNLETLENIYVRVISPLVVAIVIVTGISYFVGGYARELGFILAVGLALNGFLLPAFSIVLTRRPAKELSAVRADLSSRVIEYLNGLEDLQSSGADLRWVESINQLGESTGKTQLVYSRLNALNSSLALIILNFTILGLLWVAIPLVDQGKIGGVSLAVIVLVGMSSFESVSILPQAAVNLTASLEAAKRLFALGRDTPSTEKDQNQSLDWVPSQIELQNVTFEYNRAQSFKLNQISFKIEKGKKLALIGPSGSGKTSLTNLLLRFWSPTSGKIMLDEVNVDTLNLQQVISCFAVISQRSHLFSVSLRENLLLASVGVKDDELIQALHQVELDEWFSGLPEGLDTWLGDDGLRISGGERQRLLIARAILMDRPFLILDEPTANLDPINSKKIMQTIFRISESRGLLWITHDLSLLDEADKILLLENGSIIESGTYDLLMKENSKLTSWLELNAHYFE